MHMVVMMVQALVRRKQRDTVDQGVRVDAI